MDRTLLLVDDEENIVRAMKRLLRGDGYTIISANSGREALQLLDSQEVGVIVSDQRMPGMSGVEFLHRVKEKYPDNVRIVLSGYTDLNSITSAINEGSIYKFLTKPWDDDHLRNAIKEAFIQYELAHENKRLSLELQKANEELSSLNTKLQRNVEQKSRFVDINLCTLQVCQEILENLPVALLGIGTDGLIAVANLKAHELIWPGEGTVVGRFANDVLPEMLATCYHEFYKNHILLNKRIELQTNQVVDLTICPVGRESGAHGSILTLHKTSVKEE